MTDRAVLHAVLRCDLTSFIIKAFQTASPGDAYVHNWHIEAIAHELTRCRDGESRRLLVTQPPRSLKSICTSVAFVAWALGHDPKLRFICVSYSQDLALELARQFRLVVDSDWYAALFARMRLKKDSGAECVTTEGGGRLATSIGGTLTGRGADYILIDDPLKAEEAQSAAARQRVIDWYTGTLTTRLNDKREGRIVIVMQRLHEDDLAGHVLINGAEAWRHLDLPAIALEDEEVATAPGKGHRRKAGEPLQPEREPLTVLERIRSEIGSLKFSAQYQQRPIPMEGNLIKRTWLQQYDAAPEGPGAQIVQSWDLASSIGTAADYSACVTAIIHKQSYYIVDAWRGRLAFPDLKRRIVEHARIWKADVVLIEDAGPGLSMLQTLRNEAPKGCPRPIGIKPQGDKPMRMEGCSATIEQGSVFLPSEAPWLAAFLNEILAFPNARNDDQVDAFSQLLNWAAKRRPRGLIATHPPEIIRIEPEPDGF